MSEKNNPNPFRPLPPCDDIDRSVMFFKKDRNTRMPQSFFLVSLYFNFRMQTKPERTSYAFAWISGLKNLLRYRLWPLRDCCLEAFFVNVKEKKTGALSAYLFSIKKWNSSIPLINPLNHLITKMT